MHIRIVIAYRVGKLHEYKHMIPRFKLCKDLRFRCWKVENRLLCYYKHLSFYFRALSFYFRAHYWNRIFNNWSQCLYFEHFLQYIKYFSVVENFCNLIPKKHHWFLHFQFSWFCFTTKNVIAGVKTFILKVETLHGS